MIFSVYLKILKIKFLIAELLKEKIEMRIFYGYIRYMG